MWWKDTFGALILVPAILASFSPEAEAQRRHAVYHYRPTIRVYGGFYSPYFGFYYGPWYGAAYPYAHIVHYGPGYYDRSSVRIQVKPVETEVFVDGYYAGVVDDFDGFFQRLYLPPGEHEIQLYLEGHQTIPETLYLGPGSSYKIRHQMQPLAAGEAGGLRPQPTTPKTELEGAIPRPRTRELERAPQPEGVLVTPERAPSASIPSRFGVLALRAQPTGADIFIDGEPWPLGGETDELVIHLPVGVHRIEIRKEAYQPFATEVEVLARETTSLNVRLPPLEPR